MRATLRFLSVLLSVLALGACDGGSGSDKKDAVVPPPITPPEGTFTGYLVDSGVSGVAYKTATQQGVTGSEGDFQYEGGETVRFLIGDTLLGEVTGQERITPFDLAGSAVITGSPDITRALNDESNPFNAVTNIAVLLQTLDRDGDPENGIEILPEVAALFEGVSLNMAQPWNTFRESFALRHALGQANTQDFFSEPHGIANPAPALQSLYAYLGIDARTLAVSLQKREDEEPVSYEYDTNGNLVRVALPAGYTQGDDVLRHLTRVYEYDVWGNQTLLEEHDYNELRFYEGGEILILTIVSDIETRLYSAVGHLTEIERERRSETELKGIDGNSSETSKTTEARLYDINGSVIRVEKNSDGTLEDWQYQYGPEGELLRVDGDFTSNIDEIENNVTTYQYDENGWLLAIEMNGTRFPPTAEALGIPGIEYFQLAETYRVTYEYDADGHLARDIREGGSASLGRQLEVRQYGLNGKVTRLERTTDYYSDPTDQRTSFVDYEYDDQGNTIREVEDFDGDGAPDATRIWHYEYDSVGNVLRLEQDLDGDGEADDVFLWEYDADGYLVSKQGYFGRASFDYEATGWGHIFAAVPLQEQDSPLSP